MPLRRHSRFATIMAFVVLAAMPEIAVAKRIAGFVPPPYWARFFISLLTLVPVAALRAATSYLGAKQLDRVTCQARRLWLLGASVVLTAAGAGWAASDGYNDELWSPYVTGSLALSLLVPLAVVFLTKRWNTWVRVLVAVLIAVPSWFVTTRIAMGWQFWGMSKGLPTTW